MSESSLRDALKELRTYCGKYVDDPDASEAEQLAYDDVCIQLAQILDKHPAEPVGVSDEAAQVEIADEARKAARDAALFRWGTGSADTTQMLMSVDAALAAAAPLLGTRPQPTLDRSVVEQAIRDQFKWLGAPQMYSTETTLAADAVMALARPLPTREQIDEVLQLHRVGVGDPRHHDPRFPGALNNYRRKLRNALLALFTGGKE